jgi:hypothetical protein
MFKCFVMPFSRRGRGEKYGWYYKDSGDEQEDVKPPFEMLMERAWWLVGNEV